MSHSFLKESGRCLLELLECSPCKLCQLDVSCSVIDHECSINAVYRNLGTSYIERYQGSVSADCYPDLCSGWSLHETHHAVLRSLVACYGLLIDLDDPVSLHQARLLGRTARNCIQDYCSIVRHIESDSDALEVSCEFTFGLCQLYRWKIDRMRIQFCQGSGDGSIRHALHVDGIHIVLLDLLQDKIQLSPSVIIPVKLSLRFKDLGSQNGNKHSQDNAQKCYHYIIIEFLHMSVNLFNFDAGSLEKIHAISQSV